MPHPVMQPPLPLALHPPQHIYILKSCKENWQSWLFFLKIFVIPETKSLFHVLKEACMAPYHKRSKASIAVYHLQSKVC